MQQNAEILRLLRDQELQKKLEITLLITEDPFIHLTQEVFVPNTIFFLYK